MVNKKGMVGIGHMIIFIAALIALAAVVGTLLSRSSSFIQRGTNIGTGASDVSKNGLEIIKVTGKGDDVYNDKIEEFRIFVRLRPASAPINLTATLLQWKSSNYAGKEKYDSTTFTSGYYTIARVVHKGPEYKDGYVHKGDELEIKTIPIANAENYISTNEEVSITFLSPSSSPSKITFVTPGAIQKNKWYSLYG